MPPVFRPQLFEDEPFLDCLSLLDDDALGRVELSDDDGELSDDDGAPPNAPQQRDRSRSPSRRTPKEKQIEEGSSDGWQTACCHLDSPANLRVYSNLLVLLETYCWTELDVDSCVLQGGISWARAMHVSIGTLLELLPGQWICNATTSLHVAFPEYKKLDLRGILLVEVARSKQVQEDVGMRGYLLDAVEFFAGKHELTQAQKRAGLRALAVDRKYSSVFALETAKGLRTSTALLRFLRTAGLHWMGVECMTMKTYIWVVRATMGRSKENPRGFELSNPMVEEANTVATVVVFFALLDFIRDIPFVCEQPMSSLFNSLPEVEALIRATRSSVVMTQHGAFGGESVKPLKLMGTPSWLPLMKRTLPAGLALKTLTYVDAKGGVNGFKSDMKDSEHYTIEFGEAVTELQLADLWDAGLT